jgi:hypothetical protein
MSTVRAGLGGITRVIASEENGFPTFVDELYGIVFHLDVFPISLIKVVGLCFDTVPDV